MVEYRFPEPFKILKVKKLHPDAKISDPAKPGDVGLDLTAISKKVCIDTQTVIYGFGLVLEIPPGHFGMIVPRSSIYKTNMYLSNHCGIVDENFRGEIKAIFRIDSNAITSDYKVGDRIAQLIVLPYPRIEIEEVEELSVTERGSGGFGSSGK